MSDTTPIETRIDILADFYIDYKNNEQFEDFFTYNDLGLPLAYALSSGIVTATGLSDSFINETFDLLLEVLGIDEDTGFDTLADLVALVN
jgi:hypothetical protein